MPDLKCEDCDLTVAASSRWARVRAHDAGWYFRRDGRAFCPAHRPDYAPSSLSAMGANGDFDQRA